MLQYRFFFDLEIHDEQSWVCARLRMSQETMNLATTEDNRMKLSMCEDPHVPGNYEPGDDRRQLNEIEYVRGSARPRKLWTW